MKRLRSSYALLWFCCLMLSTLMGHGQSFQKVVRYLGDEDYMEHAAFHDSAQAVIGMGYVTDSDNVPVLARFDLNGQALWQVAATEVPGDYFGFDCLGMEGNGIFVGGQEDLDTSSSYIMRLDLNGTPTWTRIFGNQDGNVDISALAGDRNGNLAFGGQFHNFNTFHFDAMVGKVRASDGAQLWTRTIGDTLDILVKCVTTTPSGDVIAAGNVDDWPIQMAHFPWIAKWSANGTLLWSKRLDYDAVVNGLQVDADNIYLAGYDFQNGVNNRLFVAKLTHSGSLSDWQAISNPDQSTEVQDLKLDGDGLTLVAPHYDYLTGNETALIMRLDTALQPVYAWLDEFAVPYAIAGTDANGMLHFVGSYFGDPNNDEVIVVGTVPDMAISPIPCGMVPYTPVFVSESPTVLSYAVTSGSISRDGYAIPNMISLPLTPLTDCMATGIAAPQYSLEAWPNPTTGLLQLRLPDEATEITLMSIDGREVLRTTASGETGIDLAQVPQGVYLLRASTGAGSWITKVVKVN